MDMNKIWKSREEKIEETIENEIEVEHKQKKAQAQTLLLNKVAEDYILSQEVPNEEKDLFISLFEPYNPNFKLYGKKEKFEYEGNIYEVISSHTSEPTYKPNEIPALYKLFFQQTTSDGTNIIPEWQPPIGDTITYPTGALVVHKDKVWESLIDNNVWEPGVYGWEEYVG